MMFVVLKETFLFHRTDKKRQTRLYRVIQVLDGRREVLLPSLFKKVKELYVFFEEA
ncbi:MAG: hypothetical protein SWO11_07155 [Thermodesulfobacteriota bacterium]|nr:hypothetical protein [Thermodesulfobacteriota bacterium]